MLYSQSEAATSPETKSPVGLLYSQVGYDAGFPVRVIVRGPDAFLSPAIKGAYTVENEAGEVVGSGNVADWGELWGSHWWVAELSLPPGRYRLVFSDGEGMSLPHRPSAEELDRFPITTGLFMVAPHHLWQETWFHVGISQGERRRVFARASRTGGMGGKLGWYDAGMDWQEASSHVAYILGFCDLLQYAKTVIPADLLPRIEAQILNGCDYLTALQERAGELPDGTGGVVHQIWRFDEIILPGDVSKAALAWALSARVLSDSYTEKKAEYRRRAVDAMAYLRRAEPMGPVGVNPINNGVPDDFVAPKEWLTRDLLMQAWAAFELAESGSTEFRDEAVALAERIMERQIPQSEARDGLYGHFRAYASADVTEKSWTHNGDKGIHVSDLGGHFPHYVLPLLYMSESWPDHPDAPRWKQCVQDFAYGYFAPACRANPFFLLPLGQFAGEGLLWFAGSWHGMNAAYGLAATMALEFERAFTDANFAEIAVGNLQWVAGLNAGLTAESLFAAHVFSQDVPPGVALPVSMINGIGARCAGNWMNFRGAICNGFSVGQQFKFDTPATKANDAPSAFTDEDWISHAGGWLSAISRLQAFHPATL